MATVFLVERIAGQSAVELRAWAVVAPACVSAALSLPTFTFGTLLLK
jgi:hypothetical protein